MFKLSRFVVVLAGVFRLLQAQPETPPPTFDVVSVKPSGDKSVRGSEGGPGSKDPGRYSYGKATLMSFIITAYDVDPSRVYSKIPLDEQQFDLVAKVPEGATKKQFRLMMQAFLAERFHLKAHLESRDFSAYELVVAKSGLKIGTTKGTMSFKAQQKPGFPVVPAGRADIRWVQLSEGGYILFRLRSQQEPISALANAISLPGEPRVVDRTGLTEHYDFTFEFARELPHATPTDPPPAPDLLHALRQQLGLDLVPKKLPFDVVVVDSVSKIPTAN